MSTQADIDHNYRRIKILLEDTDSFVLTFALYRDAKEQRENAKRLREMLELPITQVALKGDNLNPVRTFLNLPKEPRQAIFFTFLGSSLPEGKSDFDKFAGYVNIQREAFTDAPHAVVLWLREEQLVRLMRRAPDFWAWRSGVFDFRGELTEASTTYHELEFTSANERTQLEEQVALYREILKSQLQRNKPDAAYIIRTRLRLAKALFKLNLHEEMASEARSALFEAQMLENETLTMNAYGVLAIAQHKLGYYDEAEHWYHKAIELLGNGFGNDAGYVASLGSLAELLTTIGRYDEAEPLYRQAVEHAERMFGRRHLSYIHSLMGFAKLLTTMKQYDDAELLYRRAIDVLVEAFGKEQPEYATTILNLIGLLLELERDDEAEFLFRELVEVTAETHGKEHPNYIRALQNLAYFLAIRERYDEAELFLNKALEESRRFLGEAHPLTKSVEADCQLFKQERLEAEQAVSKTA